MNRRFFFFVAGLGLLSIAVLCLVTVVLPAWNIHGALRSCESLACRTWCPMERGRLCPSRRRLVFSSGHGRCVQT